MLKCSKLAGNCRPARKRLRGSVRKANTILRPGFLMLASICLLFQPACGGRKQKNDAPQAPPAPVRIVFLPLNIQESDTELRWVSMTTPILMAKVSADAPDLEVVPLWESMPVALELLGTSRTITPEVAASIAERLSAKWATQGELASAQEDISLLLDFIPARSSMIPYRYEKRGNPDSLGGAFNQAFVQFLRYLVLRPLAATEAAKGELSSWRPLAEALDREYGWFSPADPGKAEKIVGELSRADDHLARVLFSPTLYPALGSRPSASAPDSNSPSPTTPDKKPPQTLAPAPSGTSIPVLPSETAPRDAPAPRPADQAGAKTADRKSPPTPPAENPSYELPAPSSFTQRRTASSAGHGAKSVDEIQPTNRLNKPALPRPEGTAKSAATTIPTAAAKASPSERNKASPTSNLSLPKIQVYSSRSQSNAAAIASKLEREGLHAVIEQADLREKGLWYRIRLEGYKSISQAKAEGERLQEAGLIQDFWIVP